MKSHRVFIDLGAYNGDTINLAAKHLGEFDEVHGFEPLSAPYQEMKKRFASKKNYHLYPAAGDVSNGEAKVYVGQNHGDISSSLYRDNPNIAEENYQSIETIDFPEFLRSTFGRPSPERHITLKMNIEGSEYPILRRMLEDDSIQFINELYCDWHWYFVDVTEQEHHDLVCQLRDRGFSLCGDKPDELYCTSKQSPDATRRIREKTFRHRDFKLNIKRRAPAVFRIAKSLNGLRHRLTRSIFGIYPQPTSETK